MVTLGSGQYTYEVSGENWGKIPEGWFYKEATSVDVDSKDNVYVFNRGNRPGDAPTLAQEAGAGLGTHDRGHGTNGELKAGIEGPSRAKGEHRSGDHGEKREPVHRPTGQHADVGERQHGSCAYCGRRGPREADIRNEGQPRHDDAKSQRATGSRADAEQGGVGHPRGDADVNATDCNEVAEPGGAKLRPTPRG